MEDGKKVTKKPEVVRIPPPRGRIKAKIFKKLAKQLKIAATVIGLFRKKQRNGGGGGGGGSSSSTSTVQPLLQRDTRMP